MNRIFGIFLIACVALRVSAETFNVNNVPSQAPAFCNLKTEKGACRAIHTRFQYDSALGRCVKFIYGGCGGTKNLFFSMEECTKVCFREPEHQRAFGSGSQDCKFEANLERKCGIDPLKFDIENCADIANQQPTEDECKAKSCCWIPDAGICYQKTSALARSSCKVNYASDSGFQGKIVLQAENTYAAGWSGYLNFDKAVTDAFCILRNDYSPDVEVTEVLHGRKGFIITGLGPISAGQTLTVAFSGSFGNSTFTHALCQDLNTP